MKTDGPLTKLVRSVGSAAIVLACCAFLGCHIAAAAWLPDRHVEIISGQSPGSGGDIFARSIERAARGEKLVAVPVQVVNKPGGGGAIASAYLNQHPGNGHYLMVISPSFLGSQITGLSAVSRTDVTPVAQMGADYVVFVVHADSPMKTGKDLLERLRTDTASVTIAIAGIHNRIAAAIVAKAAGADVRRLKLVSFNGSPEMVAALLGGRVDLIVNPAAAVLAQFQAGKVRLLAAASERRLGAALSAVPTWKELGVSVVAANWRTVVGPKGMSEDQVRYWDGVLGKVLQTRQWKSDLEASLLEDTYLDSRETRKYMESLYAEMSAVLKELGLAK
jgi:putative tricarboxylic transport membrane protein